MSTASEWIKRPIRRERTRRRRVPFVYDPTAGRPVPLEQINPAIREQVRAERERDTPTKPAALPTPDAG